MAGSELDPEAMTDSQKLDRLMAQMTTMNSRLNDYGVRIARTKKSLAVKKTPLTLSPSFSPT